MRFSSFHVHRCISSEKEIFLHNIEERSRIAVASYYIQCRDDISLKKI